MTITDLYIYPIKSLGGIRLTEAQVLTEGLQYDRRWMLVDKQNKFLSQREHAIMALFKTCIQNKLLHITFEGKGSISVPLTSPQSKAERVVVWDDHCSGYEVSAEANTWFSDILGQEVRLVRLPELSDRPTDPRYAEGHRVSYADGFPFLIIGQASLDELNKRMGLDLPMDRFRPNIVFSGADPFAEDEMLDIQIGDCDFKVVKPCARCVVTTIDQQTGEKSKEPLKTLSSFRNVDNKVLFGQNMIATKLGAIKTGDDLKVIHWKK